MMQLFRLIAEWRARLGRIRALTDDASAGHAWLWAIQARILKFLISRYETASGSAETPSTEVEGREPPIPKTFCTVVSADGPPPRSGAVIGALLEDVRRCNQRGRRAWFGLWGIHR